MKRLSSRLLAALVVFGLGLGCTRTTEDETEDFKKNTEKAKGLAALYPGFTAPIEAKIQEATKVFEAGKALSDEEKAAEVMGQANEVLTGGFMKTLAGIDKEMKEVRSALPEVQTAAFDEATRAGARTAVEEAQRVLASVEDRLKGGARDEAGARAVLGRVTDDLEAAQKLLDKAKERIAEAKKAVDAHAAGVAGERKAAEEKAAPWKCEYCGGSNDPSLKQCNGCGAARPQS